MRLIRMSKEFNTKKEILMFLTIIRNDARDFFEVVNEHGEEWIDLKEHIDTIDILDFVRWLSSIEIK